jgi:hypothetical protein
MSQNHNNLELETTGVKKFVQSEYLYWLDKSISKHIREPVHASSVASQNPPPQVFLGYFESLFTYFTIYEKFLKRDNLFIWNPAATESKDEEDHDTLRRTQDMVDYDNEGGVLLTQAGTAERGLNSKDAKSKDTGVVGGRNGSQERSGGLKKYTNKVRHLVT